MISMVKFPNRIPPGWYISFDFNGLHSLTGSMRSLKYKGNFSNSLTGGKADYVAAGSPQPTLSYQRRLVSLGQWRERRAA
jgi:hypothetical protein